jgi:hypothetical protein
MEVNDYSENYQQGWIKLYRSSKDHWLYKTKKPKTYREAWEDMLLIVNYENKKVLIRGCLIECCKGQSLLSLDSWAREFNWTIQMVRTFFSLLENDKMITTEGMQYTTRLTICNYYKYQSKITDEQHTKQEEINTPITDGQQTDNKPLTTTKERKERKEYIYNEFYDEQLKISEHNSEYEKFIKILFGQNEDNRKLDGVLSIKNQLTFTEFLSCLEYAEKNNTKIGDKLLKIENNKKYYKDVTSLNRTLKNWLTNRFVK